MWNYWLNQTSENYSRSFKRCFRVTTSANSHSLRRQWWNSARLRWFGGWWPGEAKNRSRDPYPLCVACVQAELMELWALVTPHRQGGLACCASWGRRESDTTERLHWTQFSAFGECLCSHQTDPLGKNGKTNQQQATLLSVSISFSDPCLSITGLQENMWLAGQMTNLRVTAVNFTYQDFLQICSEKSIAGNGVSF